MQDVKVEGGGAADSINPATEEEKKAPVHPAKMTVALQTQQIRHAMAEIRNMYATREAPLLSRPLSMLDMRVQDFCYAVVLQTHKKRRHC